MSTGNTDSSEKVEIQNAYMQYQRSKGEYLNKKAKIGGGILNIAAPRNFVGDWTISGPISFHIYKKDNKIIYLFGDHHFSWNGTCARPGAKEATSLLTYNANCMAKGNCITLQQLMERCGENAKNNNKIIDIYYEDNLTNIADKLPDYKIATNDLTKKHKYLQGPINELLLWAGQCITNKTCNSLKMHPSDARHSTNFVLLCHRFFILLSNILNSSIYIDSVVSQFDTHLLDAFFTCNAEFDVFFTGISSARNNGDILLELILKSDPEVNRIYNIFDSTTKLNFYNALKSFEEYYSLKKMIIIVKMLTCVRNWYDRKKNIDGLIHRKVFNSIKSVCKEISQFSTEIFMTMPFMDSKVIANCEISLNNYNVIYAGYYHILIYSKFFTDNGYVQIYASNTDIDTRCQPISIDFQKIINFDF